MSEKELLAVVRELAKLLGWRVYHTHDSRRSEPGFPDLVMVREKSLLFVELKTGRGRLSQAQVNWSFDLEFAGADYRIWRDADWLSGRIEEALR